MVTTALFLEDAYRQSATGTVVGHEPDGAVVLDASLFYATGGGQPGDTGFLKWDGGRIEVADTVKRDGGCIALVLEQGPRPEIGTQVVQTLDWSRRYDHMRVHTALHLLSVVIPRPVTGGQISAGKGRLDFDMPDAPEDKAELETALNDLIARDLPVSVVWINDAQLDVNPSMVKTMSVSPPRGAGRVRLVRIGTGDAQVDLQPCGGTHVRSTAEIGGARLGKIEKKGRQNRRVYLHLDS